MEHANQYLLKCGVLHAYRSFLERVLTEGPPSSSIPDLYLHAADEMIEFRERVRRGDFGAVDGTPRSDGASGPSAAVASQEGGSIASSNLGSKENRMETLAESPDGTDAGGAIDTTSAGGEESAFDWAEVTRIYRQAQAHARNNHDVDMVTSLSTARERLRNYLSEHSIDDVERERAVCLLHDMGLLFRRVSMLEEAMEVYQDAAGLCQAGEGPSLAVLAGLSKDYIGGVYKKMARNTEAMDSFREAEEVLLQCLEPSDPRMAQLYIGMGTTARHLDRFAEAMQYFQKALFSAHHCSVSLSSLDSGIVTAKDWAESILQNMTTNELSRNAVAPAVLTHTAMILNKTGEYLVALKLVETAIAIVVEHSGEDSAHFARLLDQKATVCRNLCQFEEAQNLLRRSMGIWERIVDRNHTKNLMTKYTDAVDHQGGLCMNMGDYPAALEWFNKAYSMRMDNHGSVHPNTVLTLVGRAAVDRKMGKFGDCLDMLKKALVDVEELYGPDATHTVYAQVAKNVAQTHVKDSRYNESIPYFNSVKDIFIRVYGPAHEFVAVCNNYIGFALLQAGRLDEASQYLYQAEEVVSSGSNTKLKCKVLESLSMLWSLRGDYSAAEEYCDRLLTELTDMHGRSHPSYARVLLVRADVKVKTGDFGEAKELIQQTIDINKNTLGCNHPHYYEALVSLGNLKRSLGRYEDAFTHLKEAGEGLGTTLGPRHIKTIMAHDARARAYVKKGMYQEARALFDSCLEMVTETVGQQHPGYVRSLSGRCGLDYKEAKYQAAIEDGERCCALAKETMGPRHPFVGEVMFMLGRIYAKVGDFKRALGCHEDAHTLRMEVLGGSHIETAKSKVFVGLVLYSMGQYDRAMPMVNEAVGILKGALGPHHPSYGKACGSLGTILMKMGQKEDALDHFSTAVEVVKMAYQNTHPTLSNALLDRAYCLMRFQRAAEARDDLERVLEIRQSVLGEGHEAYAHAVMSMGTFHYHTGNHAEALAWYERSHELKKTMVAKGLMKPTHESIGEVFEGIGLAHWRLGNLDDAEQHLRQCVDNRRQSLGPTHVDTSKALFHLSVVKYNQNQLQDAIALIDECVSNDTTNITKWFGVLSESRQLRLLQTMEAHLHCYLALVARSNPSVDFILKCFNTVLRRKGLVFEAGKSIRVKSEDLNVGEDIRQEMATLRKLKEDLAARTFAGPKDLGEAAGWQESLQRLKQEIEGAENNLAMKVPASSLGNRLEHVSVDAVRGSLPEGAVLLEYIKVQSKEVEFENYVCFGVTASGDDIVMCILDRQQSSSKSFLVSIDRSDGDPAATRGAGAVQEAISIDDGSVGGMVALLRESISPNEGATVHLSRGADGETNDGVSQPMGDEIEDAEHGDDTIRGGRKKKTNAAKLNYVSTGHQLRRCVFDEPLCKLLKIGGERLADCLPKRIVIAPDSDLCLIPFECMVTPSATEHEPAFLIEHVEFSYIGCSRDVISWKDVQLSRNEVTRNALGTPLVMGDPLYSLPEDAFVSNEQSGDGSSGQGFGYAVRGRWRNFKFSPLTGTREEVDSLGAMLGVEAVMGIDANVECVTKRCEAPEGSPVLIHIATHGFFDTDPDASGNPMLQSGLVLAGANSYFAGRGHEMPLCMGDGVLLAHEVEQLNLSHTDLTILSACSTAVGGLARGEGVFGLRRAFLLAGSAALVVSMYSVSDATTKAIMERLYQYILRGESLSGALRQAELDQMALTPHPRDWAAFIVEGFPGKQDGIAHYVQAHSTAAE